MTTRNTLPPRPPEPPRKPWWRLRNILGLVFVASGITLIVLAIVL